MRSHRVIIAAATTLALTACAKPPAEAISAAEQAQLAAVAAGADEYSPEAMNAVTEAKAALDAEIAAQGEKMSLTRSYKRAEELAAAYKTAADQATTAAAAAKEQARQEALTLVSEGRLALDQTTTPLASVPQGRYSSATIASMRAGLIEARTSLIEAELSLANGMFLDAHSRAVAAIEALQRLRDVAVHNRIVRRFPPSDSTRTEEPPVDLLRDSIAIEGYRSMEVGTPYLFRLWLSKGTTLGGWGPRSEEKRLLGDKADAVGDSARVCLTAGKEHFDIVATDGAGDGPECETQSFGKVGIRAWNWHVTPHPLDNATADSVLKLLTFSVISFSSRPVPDFDTTYSVYVHVRQRPLMERLDDYLAPVGGVSRSLQAVVLLVTMVLGVIYRREVKTVAKKGATLLRRGPKRPNKATPKGRKK